MNQNDNDIRKFFQQMKEDNMRVSPSFLKSLEMVSSRIEKGLRRPSFFRLAATCVFVIVVAIVGFFLWHERTTKFSKYQSISEWRPPTEFLLKTPGQDWLKTVPKLGQSSLEQNNRRKE
jgi:hypothetical protein